MQAYYESLLERLPVDDEAKAHFRTAGKCVFGEYGAELRQH